MHILFIGQNGTTDWPHAAPSSPEWRVDRLARSLSQLSHQVAVVATPPFASQRLTHTHNVEIISRPSLNPERPGGWLYLLLSLWTLWRRQPDVVHLQGWRVASMCWLAALLSPETTLVWTIPTLPSRHPRLAKMLAWQAKRIVDAITTPSRTVQYILLQTYHLPTDYIPDGYLAPALKDIPTRHFGVRKDQYVVALGSNEVALKNVMRALARVATRKKLLVLQPTSSAYQHILRGKKNIEFVGQLQGRTLSSLIRQAATVIVADSTVSNETLLQAMDSGRKIIAINDTRYQEILGVAGTYVRPGKVLELAAEIKQSIRQRSKGIPSPEAQKRAQAHFTWDRIIPDYLSAYRRALQQPVPLDSLQSVPARDLSVTTK
ncbi:MAG: glycosyltransferase family 4 protein [Candidatus Andersenbacteria bacterium]